MNDRAARTILWGVLAAILTLSVFQMLAVSRVERTVERNAEVAAKVEEIRAAVAEIEKTVAQVKGDQDFIQDDTTQLRKDLDRVISIMEHRDGGGDAQPEMPEIDFTQPEMFERVRLKGAEYGIELTSDEVRVPARFVLRQGAIEYFAVLKGGKEHETVLSLRGNVAPDQRRPKDFATRLANAIQAMGVKRGTPAHGSPTGFVPPSGETVYLFVEWEEKGEKVVVRAEDLIWDRVDGKPMDRGRWVYVGSFPVVMDEPASAPVLAADAEGEIVATYNSRATLIDNTAPHASDDTVYLVASPHVPPDDVVNCTLVIRRTDREPTRTFPDAPRGTEPAPGPGPGDTPPKDTK